MPSRAVQERHRRTEYERFCCVLRHDGDKPRHFPGVHLRLPGGQDEHRGVPLQPPGDGRDGRRGEDRGGWSRG